MSDDLKNDKIPDDGTLADDFKDGELPDDAESTCAGTTFPSDNGPKLTMPDGSKICLCDINYQPMFGACMLDAAEETLPTDAFRVFSTGRSQAMPGTTNVLMQRHHTNLYRSGESGLPRECEYLVTSWWAGVSERLAEPVMGLLDTTSVRFEYNCKTYLEARLSDLVFGRVPVKEPVHLRECLTYVVYLEPQRVDAWKNWREYMREEKPRTFDVADITADLHRCNDALETNWFKTPVGALMPLSSLKLVRVRILDASNRLRLLASQPPEVSYRKMTVWIYLGGYQKRVVV